MIDVAYRDQEKGGSGTCCLSRARGDCFITRQETENNSAKRGEHVFWANRQRIAFTHEYSSTCYREAQNIPDSWMELASSVTARPHTPYLLSAVLPELAADFSSKF